MPSGRPPRGLRVSRLGAQSPLIVIGYDESAAPLPDCLSEAERAVAELVLSGRTNRDIAMARGTSVRTIANQVNAIFSKLGVRSRRMLASRFGRSPR